jgi:hypothetical protein
MDDRLSVSPQADGRNATLLNDLFADNARAAKTFDTPLSLGVRRKVSGMSCADVDCVGWRVAAATRRSARVHFCAARLRVGQSSAGTIESSAGGHSGRPQDTTGESGAHTPDASLRASHSLPLTRCSPPGCCSMLHSSAL